MTLITGPPLRPNRITDKKDEEYHVKYGRWIIDRANHVLQSRFISKTLINWNFYKGNQWIFKEDLAAFLMDESGEPRNRIRFVENLVRPIVEQYVGNAVNMDITVKARSVSDFAINRREKELGRLRFMNNLARNSSMMKEVMEDRIPLGENDAEVEQIFDNIWVDDVEQTINNLITYIADANDFEEIKVRLAKQLAISGMPILKSFERNGEQVFNVVDPLYFIFDRNAKKPDLTDSEFMGEYFYMSPAEVCERFQNITREERIAIETYAQKQADPYFDAYYLHSVVSGFEGRVPVYEVYWKDIEVKEYGYVLDEFGYEFFTLINDEDSPYTTSDLITPKDKAYSKILKGKKSRKLYLDVLRYCIFIPKEAVATPEITKDIVLEWGIVPYQETSLINPSGVSYPYKTYCWGYHNGEVLSPLDDIIAPQRYVNRLLSVMESQVNNSRGAGTVFDKDMIDPQDGEEGILRSMNTSKPVFVNAKGQLNNSLGSYDSTIGQGTMNLISIADQMRVALQRITGVNEQMQGTTGGKRELVGVTQLAIQRGTMIQEPIYFALSKVMMQAYQSMVSTGKRIYADNKRKLSIMVGDAGAQQIIVTDEMKIEDFRVFLKRTTSKEEQEQAANAVLMQMVQAGLIDQTKFANAFNRVDMDGVGRVLREMSKEKIEAEREMRKQQEAYQQQLGSELQEGAQNQMAQQEAEGIMAGQQQQAMMEQEQANKLEQIMTKAEADKRNNESRKQ